jgi:hypothetical protein
MLQYDGSPPSFSCTVKEYLGHLAGGSVVVVNIIGHSDHRTLATYVLFCWGSVKDLLYQQMRLFLSGFAFYKDEPGGLTCHTCFRDLTEWGSMPGVVILNVHK